MKNIILIVAFLAISLTSNAQFKINNYLFTKGFSTDTATSISIKVVSLNVSLETKEQRPVFYLSFNEKNGSVISDRNINYDELIISAKKNGYPDSQTETVVQQTILAILCGTKTQKLTAIRGLLDVYNIIVKPDSEQ